MGNSWEMHILGAMPSFGEKSFDFDDWLEKKRLGRKHLDLTFELKIGAWGQSYYVLAVKYNKCLGIIAGGDNLDTKVNIEAIKRLIQVFVHCPRFHLMCFYTFEQIACLRGYPKLIHMLHRDEKLKYSRIE